ncbi:MAG: translation elongation factor-like protein [Candidatus Geothermarchaeales archaeon]
MTRKRLGKVVNFFRRAQAAAVELKSELALGDVITIAGSTTDLTQTVESLQIENKPVKSAGPGDIVGIRVVGRVRPNDLVYKESD